MVPDPDKSCIGLEYFCFEGDGLWTTPDDELVELGKQEMDRLGLIRYEDVEDGAVIRMPKAYPVYDEDYREHLTRLKDFVADLDNFQTVGRNGLHRVRQQGVTHFRREDPSTALPGPQEEAPPQPRQERHAATRRWIRRKH